jgi:tetratricopeptide (TPR) repeat protein
MCATTGLLPYDGISQFILFIVNTQRERFAMKPIQLPLLFVLTLTLFVVPGGCSQPSNQSLLERGNYAMWQGRWSDAADDFIKSTKQHPGDWKAQYQLGQCYMKMGKSQKAAQSLAIAESLQPHNDDIADAYAESLLQCGERDRLFSFLERRANKQQTVQSWITFASYAMDLDDPDAATEAINNAISVSDGTSARPFIIAASFAERLGDDPLAVSYWQEAWIVEPGNDNISNALRAHGIVPGPTMTGVDDSE